MNIKKTLPLLLIILSLQGATYPSDPVDEENLFENTTTQKSHSTNEDLKNTTHTRAVKKETIDDYDGLYEALEFLSEIDWTDALIRRLFEYSDQREGAWSIFKAATYEMLIDSAYKIFTNSAARIGHTTAAKALHGKSMPVIPTNVKSFIKLSLRYRARSQVFSHAGYNKIVQHLMQPDDYKRCVNEYKKELRKYYVNYLKSHQIDFPKVIEEFDRAKRSTHTGYIDLACQQLTMLDEFFGERNINPKQFEHRFLNYLAKNKKTFSELVSPYVNKKRLLLIQIAGSIAGIGTHTLLHSLKHKYGLLPLHHKKDSCIWDTSTMKWAIAHELLPTSEYGNGIVLWKNTLGIKETTTYSLKNFISCYITYAKMTNDWDNFKSDDDDSLIWKGVAIIFKTMFVLGSVFSMYERLENIYYQHEEKFEKAMLKIRMFLYRQKIYRPKPYQVESGQ